MFVRSGLEHTRVIITSVVKKKKNDPGKKKRLERNNQNTYKACIKILE